MKASYHDAKLNNDKAGNEPNFPPFYEDFESILGCILLAWLLSAAGLFKYV